MFNSRHLLPLIVGLLAIGITATAGAFAGAQLVAGEFQPVIVDFTQVVPVEITAPVELDNGEIITLSAPVTVNVELRISIDGERIATLVKEESVAESTKVATQSITSESPDSVTISGLAWRITQQENLGKELVWNRNISFTTSGQFIRLSFEIENLGETPIELLQHDDRVDAFLADALGRQFAEMNYEYQFNEVCRYAQINPGLIDTCIMVFETPTDVESLTLHLSKDNEIVEVPLEIK